MAGVRALSPKLSARAERLQEATSRQKKSVMDEITKRCIDMHGIISQGVLEKKVNLFN